MSTDAEAAHSSRGTPPPHPAHPPTPPRRAHTVPAQPSAPPRPTAPPGRTPDLAPDPDTPVLGVPAKVPLPRGSGPRGDRPPSAERPTGPRTPPRPVGPPHPATPGGIPGGAYGAATGRRRSPGRAAAAAACLILGLGLLGGAAAGSWLDGGAEAPPSTADTYAHARTAWHTVPVDTLFPRTLHGAGEGPGGADRSWTRIAVAPDSSCGGGFDPLLGRALAPVGCKRLLRATYTDATSTNVTTVGLLIATSDAPGMRALHKRFATEKLDERTDLLPRPYAAKGTAAARFGDDQRASWHIRILTDVPAVVYSVSGFADGRKVTDPSPAEEAIDRGATTAPAQSGLGHDARALSDEIVTAFRRGLAAVQEGSA
ncbi:hypothetical protein [Streptomyces sp. NPDC048636]|uniref:hypothetical protein n=1 Tax=Streptomyces sp. NPDC048636 TaxID=3155762 RepID=UPI003417E108